MATKRLKRRPSSIGNRLKPRSSSVPDRWKSYRSKKKTDALLSTYNGPATGPPSEAPPKPAKPVGVLKSVKPAKTDQSESVMKRVSFLDLEYPQRSNFQIASDKLQKYFARSEVVRSADLWWVIYFFQYSEIQPLLWSMAFVSGFLFSDWHGWLNMDQIKLSIEQVPFIEIFRSASRLFTFGLPLVLDPWLFSICFLAVSVVTASMEKVEYRIVLFEETF